MAKLGVPTRLILNAVDKERPIVIDEIFKRARSQNTYNFGRRIELENSKYRLPSILRLGVFLPTKDAHEAFDRPPEWMVTPQQVGVLLGLDVGSGPFVDIL